MSDLKKVSINLNTRSIANINSLSKCLGEKNKTRVISSSLEIARTIMLIQDFGSEIVIRHKDGSEQVMKFIST